MVEVSANLVKQLREATNVSMMECKRALVEAGGDMEKATKLLRERGMAVAAKKAGRATNQGLIASAARADQKIVSLIEINCETDFVARNEVFKTFVDVVATRALSTDGELAAEMQDDVTQKITEIGENMGLRRNVRFVLSGKGKVASYIHLGGKVGVLVELACEKDETAANPVFEELVKDLTLHVAATSPRYLTPSDVPSDVIAAEKEIFAVQMKDKPANMVDKIVEGKVQKFFSDVCFINQLFVKDDKLTITQLLARNGKELGDTLVVKRFVRYQLGA
jgi:elongation factor Ts